MVFIISSFILSVGVACYFIGKKTREDLFVSAGIALAIISVVLGFLIFGVFYTIEKEQETKTILNATYIESLGYAVVYKNEKDSTVVSLFEKINEIELIKNEQAVFYIEREINSYGGTISVSNLKIK